MTHVVYHPGTPHDFVRDADGKPATDKASPTFADAPAGTPAHAFHPIDEAAFDTMQ
jgi:hypothetical protein